MTVPNAGKDAEKQHLLCITGQNVNFYSHFEK